MDSPKFMTPVHCRRVQLHSAGADPENLYGRWLMGWLYLNYTGAKRVAG